MARVVMELTNRCNLRCRHCFGVRHAGTGDLPLTIIEKVLGEARSCGIDHVSFTGGEPTLHRQFPEIVRRVCDAGCTFSFVSNGSTLPQIYPLLLAHRGRFKGVTFSLDGARQETHDGLRGPGSYRQVMRAASICNFKGLDFTLNMVLTTANRDQIEEMVELAGRLGSRGVRFGHVTAGHGTEIGLLEIPPNERRETEAAIWRLQKTATVPVGMSPGYYSETPFFPCGPLELEEFNIDYRGNLTLCCQLSGQSGATTAPDLIADLGQMSLGEGCARFRRRVATYLEDKRACVAGGEFEELDHFPCRYCVRYLGRGMHEQTHPVTLKTN